MPDLDEDCRCSLNTNLEQLSTTMADSEEIEVRASISMNLLIVRPHKQMCIADIGEKDLDLQLIQNLPGIVGYIVQDGDCLWDIARKYYTTPRRIMEMNGLETETVSRGDHLIYHEGSGKGGGVEEGMRQHPRLLILLGRILYEHGYIR